MHTVVTHGITTNKVHFGVTVPATNQTTCSKVCHGIRRCFQSLARSTDIRSQTGCEEHLSSALLLVTVDSAKNLPVSLPDCAIISYACTTYIIVPEHIVLNTHARRTYTVKRLQPTGFIVECVIFSEVMKTHHGHGVKRSKLVNLYF